MSATYTLWCLIKGDKNPFLVTSSSTTYIASLKQVIKEERSHFLQEVDASDLILWMPTNDIKVWPANDLAQRITTELQDLEKFAEVLDPAATVSDAFNHRSDAVLHIVVELEFPRKKRKRDSDNIRAEDVWNQFRQTWWGDPLGHVLASRDGNCFLHLKHVEPGLSLGSEHSELFVREEYLLFSERCRNVREHTDYIGCLIHGQLGIGKSLFLLFLLLDCLARREEVLFTSGNHEMYLFDAAGVWVYDPANGLPETGSRIFSLVDCPVEKKPLPHEVTTKSSPRTFFVAALSPNPVRYHEIIKRRVASWWMQPWDFDELVALFGKVKVGPKDKDGATHDAEYVREAYSKVGPCPRDIIRHILSPALDKLTKRIMAIDASQIIRPLQNEDILSYEESHKVILVRRVGPLSPTAHRDDRYSVHFKSRWIFYTVLEHVNRSHNNEIKEWYSLCKGMGFSTASLAGFVFEGLAISYTSGSSPDPDDTDSFRDFVQMTRVKSDNKAMPIRFAYQGSNKQLTVDISGDQIMFRILPSHVLAASTHNSSLDPPWKGRTRNRVTYDKIESLTLNDSSYYCPLQPNNPLFDAFFLSIDDRTVVLWILQMTIARVHSGARRGFPLVKSLRERASRIWKHHQVEIKYVLVIPHIGSTYHVEWNFDAGFENHKGKVFVQFLNVAPFPLDGITMMKDIFGLNEVEVAT